MNCNMLWLIGRQGYMPNHAGRLGWNNYHEDSRRIAHKFIATTERLFEKHGNIFEKTDAETGELSVADYVPPPMMGWSAGIYLRCREFLDSSHR